MYLNKYRYYFYPLVLVIVSLFFNCNSKIKTEEIVAQVGDAVLTRQELTSKLNWQGIHPDQESQFIRQWVDRELMYQEAKRLKLQEDEALKYQLQLVEKEFLVNKLLNRIFAEKIQIKDEQILKYYKDNKENFIVNEDQINANHILTSTRAHADLARKKLLNSTPFADVVRETSIGMFKDEDGKMGFFSEKDVIPELWKAAKRLNAGDISRVFTSSHGFHVLQIIEKRTANDYKPFDQVKDEIKLRLNASKQRAAYFDLIVELRNKQMVYINVPGKMHDNPNMRER